jgi:hypothetical protein
MSEKMIKRGKRISSVAAFYNRIKNGKGVCILTDGGMTGKPTVFYDAEEARNLPFIIIYEGVRSGYWYEANEV